MDLRRREIVTGRVRSGTVRAPTIVAGTVRRLVYMPDGGEGYLVATLDDGMNELEVHLPRAQADDWAPGAEVTAEGEMHGSGFVARAYLAPPDPAGVRVWIEVAPLAG